MVNDTASSGLRSIALICDAVRSPCVVMLDCSFLSFSFLLALMMNPFCMKFIADPVAFLTSAGNLPFSA